MTLTFLSRHSCKRKRDVYVREWEILPLIICALLRLFLVCARVLLVQSVLGRNHFLVNTAAERQHVKKKGAPAPMRVLSARCPTDSPSCGPLAQREALGQPR